jgi:hypothetical protein
MAPAHCGHEVDTRPPTRVVGALVFILFVPTQYAVQLQLLGGI